MQRSEPAGGQKLTHALACVFTISPSPYFSIVLTFSLVISGACPDVFYRDVKTKEMTPCVIFWTSDFIHSTYICMLNPQINLELLENIKRSIFTLANSIYFGL